MGKYLRFSIYVLLPLAFRILVAEERLHYFSIGKPARA